MTEKHTPGPWVSRKMKDYVYLDGDEWEAFARVVVKVDGKPEPEGEANARLIAAAPEMLEALRAINVLVSPGTRTLDETWRDMGFACDRARAAIAKAEGRE